VISNNCLALTSTLDKNRQTEASLYLSSVQSYPKVPASFSMHLSYFSVHRYLWKTPAEQGRNEVRWSPGQEASLAPQRSNLKSFGSNCTVLKKVLVTLLGLFGAPAVIRRPGIYAPNALLVTPLLQRSIKLVQMARYIGQICNLAHPHFIRRKLCSRKVPFP